jgi:hypothetical protein
MNLQLYLSALEPGLHENREIMNCAAQFVISKDELRELLNKTKGYAFTVTIE